MEIINGFEHYNNIAIGENTSNNIFSSANVTANADGSVLERLEWIQTAVGGAAGQLRVFPSATGTVEQSDIVRFSVSLFDIYSGAISSANINITGITQTMERSRDGGAYTSVTDPTVSFSKANGVVYMDYEFKSSQWEVGDMYRMTLSGITCTVGGSTAYVPTMVWNNVVVEAEDVKNYTQYLYGVADGGTTYPTKVVDNSILSLIMTKDSGGDTSDFDNSTDSLEAISDKITDLNADVGNPSARANLQSIEAMLGNPDASDKTIYGNIGDFKANTNLTTLKDVLGVPDVAGKPLYTVLVTDRLDNASYGLSALNTDLDTIISKLATGVGQPQVFVKSVTSAANAGSVTLATVSTNPVIIDSICVQANSASQTDLTSAAVYGGTSNAITFLNTTDAAKANIDAVDECVSWVGAVRLAAGKTIVMDLQGTGATAVDLKVSITYHAEAAGGTLV